MRISLRLLLAIGLLATTPAALQADDWGLTRERAPKRSTKPKRAAPRGSRAPTSDGDAVMRERYLRMLLRQPLESFALERLLALHRRRDGNLDALARDLEQRSTAEPKRVALWLLRGRVEAARGQPEQARRAYERAVELDRESPGPVLLLAELAREAGDGVQAERLLQQALTRTRGARREQILRDLAALALDREDFAAAEARFDEIGGAGQRKAELARALSARGHHGRAADAYATAARELRGDNRVLAPVLLEQARAELEAGRIEPALATLDRARKAAGGAAGIRFAVDELRVEVHRRAGTLETLVGELEAQKVRSFERLQLLGRVLDELGRHEDAVATLRRALAIRPGHVDSRQRVIRILTARGELSAAIAEYRKLIAASPRDPRHLLELAQLLMQSGQRGEALRLLAQAARKHPRDAGLQRAVHDLYTRWGERKLAARALERLVRIEPDDPAHLIALGEQHLEDGNQKAALASWRRILRVTRDRAKGHAALAGTYMDHDMPERALAEWEAAVRLAPRELRYIRGLAEALERLHRPADAVRQWERVLEIEHEDRVARREARRRLARLWALTGQLGSEIAKLEKAFGWRRAGPVPKRKPGQAPPDVEAGRMLAEAYAMLGRGRGRRRGEARYIKEAERVLARVIELAPGDVDSMLALERARTARGDAEGALEVLERLVEADPKNARTYLARMAENSLTLYRDEDAVRYAERSVALNPDDASAQRRLGDLYRARQQGERAMKSYRRAIELDERAYPIYFELAELHLARGEQRKADELLRAVMRASPDDDLVKRATHALVQLHLGSGTLASLEQSLLPLALAHTRRPVYRTLLVELYDALSRVLLERARSGGGPDAALAQKELHALGRRAIKPLLEALSDDDPNQRRIAIELLGVVGNDNAALPLLRVAEGEEGSTSQRRSALLAAGAVAGDALADRFAALTGARERRLQEAAAWTLCRMAGPRALPHLRALARSSSPTLRGYGMLGLGRARDRQSLGALRSAAQRDRSGWVRGMALLALGAQGDRQSTALLVAAASAERGPVAVAAVIALGAVGDPGAVPSLAELVFQPEGALRESALWSLGWLASARAPDSPSQLPAPEGRPRIEEINAGWLSRVPPLDGPAPAEHFAAQLADAAKVALVGTRHSTLLVLELLASQRVLGGRGEDDAALRGLVARLGPQLQPLVEHPDADVRAAAVRLLGPGADRAALLQALADDDERVRSAALEMLGGTPGKSALVSTIAGIARDDGRWWMRQRAVQALGRLGAPGSVAVLDGVVKGDPFAYVREAAVGALEQVAREKHCAGGQECARTPAVAALRRALRDTEPRVREAAGAALGRLGVHVSTD